jgi:small subunit ribosomal protein S4
MLVEPGDVIAVRERSKEKVYFSDRARELERKAVPDWMSLDALSMSGRILNLPLREEIDLPLNEQMIVEYYNR